MKADDDQRRVLVRMVVSIGTLLVCFLALLWMQREAKKAQAERDFARDPARAAWIDGQRTWIDAAPGERALWSGTVTRFVSGASEGLRAVEIGDPALRLGSAGPRDGGRTVYVILSDLEGTNLPAFGEGTQWLILVERDAEARSIARAARPLDGAAP